jgi:hypothetical protein
MNRWNRSRPNEFTLWESGFPARAVGIMLLGLFGALLPGWSLLRAPQAMVTAVSSVGQSKPPDPLDLQVQEQRFADDSMSKLRDLAAEMNRSLVSAEKMSTSLNTTVTNFVALMKRFGVGEPNTNAVPDTNSPPFNILDYGQVAQQVGTMAKELNTLVSSVNQNVPQIERLSQTATGDAQKLVDHAFHLGLVLIAVLLAGLVLAGLVYRFFAERLKRTGHPPSTPNL